MKNNDQVAEPVWILQNDYLVWDSDVPFRSYLRLTTLCIYRCQLTGFLLSACRYWTREAVMGQYTATNRNYAPHQYFSRLVWPYPNVRASTSPFWTLKHVTNLRALVHLLPLVRSCQHYPTPSPISHVEADHAHSSSIANVIFIYAGHSRMMRNNSFLRRFALHELDMLCYESTAMMARRVEGEDLDAGESGTVSLV